MVDQPITSLSIGMSISSSAPTGPSTPGSPTISNAESMSTTPAGAPVTPAVAGRLLCGITNSSLIDHAPRSANTKSKPCRGRERGTHRSGHRHEPVKGPGSECSVHPVVVFTAFRRSATESTNPKPGRTTRDQCPRPSFRVCRGPGHRETERSATRRAGCRRCVRTHRRRS